MTDSNWRNRLRELRINEPDEDMCDMLDRLDLEQKNTYEEISRIQAELTPHVRLEVENARCIPRKASVGATGYDLVSRNSVTLFVGDVVRVHTGVRMALPKGFEAQVRSRSGLASQGVIVVNSPGTIDSDYRGEVCVLMQSTKRTHEIKAGDRIAQLVIQRLPEVEFEIVEALEIDTVRGMGGFGSTGMTSDEAETHVDARLNEKREPYTKHPECYKPDCVDCEASARRLEEDSCTCKDGDCWHHGPA